jgi:hypothetical protein
LLSRLGTLGNTTQKESFLNIVSPKLAKASTANVAGIFAKKNFANENTA